MPKILTWAKVRAIRALAVDRTLTYRVIGERYGISGSHVANIVIGQTCWKEHDYAPKMRPRRKLTWPMVREIRAAYADGASGRVLAYAYDVSNVTIHFIVTGKQWRHDPDGHDYVPITRKQRIAQPVKKAA